MSISTEIATQKKSVARLIAGVFGERADAALRVAARLEKDLLDELAYDHREISPAVLGAAWAEVDSIDRLVADLVPEAPEREALAGLAASTYAFRMLAFAHIQSELDQVGGGEDRLSGVLAGLGHGLPEVRSYQKDFIK